MPVRSRKESSMNVLKIEMSKMFKKLTLKLVILATLLIVGAQTYSFYVTQRKSVNSTYDDVISGRYEQDDMSFFENSSIEGWIGCESYTPYNVMLYLLMPLLVAIPFAMSQFKEWKSGYASQMITRCGRRKYMNVKFVTVFVSGGLVIAVPLLVSMIVSMCYMPIIEINPLALQSVVPTSCMFGYIYTYHPVVYVLLYTFIDFIYGGILACMAMLVSRFVKNWFTAMTFPAVLVYFLDYGIGRLSKADTWLRTYNFAYFIDPNQGGENCLRLVPFLVITVGLLIGEYLLYAALNIRREAIER